MARLTEQEALSLLIEAVENDHAVYAGSAEAVARWKRLRVFAFNALGAEERGRRRGVEEAAKIADAMVGFGSRGAALADAIRNLAPRDSAPVCNNCKRAQKASDGRTEASIEIGPCYCDKLREARK